MPKRFTMLNWMGFNQMPDLKQLGFEDVFGAMDGTFNRSTLGPYAEHQRTPGQAALSEVEQASRRQARAAIGVEPLPQDAWQRTKESQSRVRPVLFDLEGEDFLRRCDQLRSNSRERLDTVDAMCLSVDWFRDEAAHYGVKLQVGSYFPVSWVARDTWPGDPAYHAYDKAGREDWAPLASRWDFVTPDLSIMTEDIDKQVSDSLAWVRVTREIVPRAPIVAEMQLCYAHFMPDANPKKWTLPSMADWTKYLTAILSDPDVSGLCLFGNAVLGVPQDDAAGSAENGTLRTHWRHVKDHVLRAQQVVTMLSRKRGAAPKRVKDHVPEAPGPHRVPEGRRA